MLFLLMFYLKKINYTITLMKNIFLLLFVLISIPATAQYKGQTKPNNPTSSNPNQGSKNFTDRIIYGGNLGGNLANGGYIFDISPFVGYRFLKSKKLSAGVGPIFQQQSVGVETLTRTGARLFGRFDVLNNPMLFAHSELQYLRATFKSPLGKASFNIPTLLVGAGTRMGIGTGEVLYDLLWQFQPEAFRPRLPFMLRFGFGL